MKPKKGEVSLFTKANVLPMNSLDYRVGKKASVVGWLKELYLYGGPDSTFIQITEKDRKDYEAALKQFKQVNSLGVNKDLDDYENETPLAEQVKALNKFRKEMK